MDGAPVLVGAVREKTTADSLWDDSLKATTNRRKQRQQRSLRLLLTGRACGRRGQLLRGQHSGGALGVFVLELRVDLLGEVGLALRLVELCELQLRQAGRYGRGRLGGEFVV